jgi:hypothetical protein
LPQPAGAVVVHDHVHLCGADEPWVEIEAVDHLGQVLRAAPVQLLPFLVSAACGIGPLTSFFCLDVLEGLIHGHDQETACARAGVNEPLVRLRIEHRNRHAAGVPRREELAPVPSQVAANDFLISYALDVNRRCQQRVPLELADDVGHYRGLEVYHGVGGREDRAIFPEDLVIE